MIALLAAVSLGLAGACLFFANRARAVAKPRDGMCGADAPGHHESTKLFLDTVLEHVPSTILIKDAVDLRFVYVNSAAETCLGVSRGALLGRNIRDLVPAAAAAKIQQCDVAALQAAERIVSEGEVIETTGNGQRIAHVTRVAIPGPDGTAQYLLTMMDDVTEKLQAARNIAYMAHHDGLTDLPNRSLFNQRLAQAALGSGGIGKETALLALDLDRFKEVNDTLGHPAGDAVLRIVAARLRGCVREGDTLARLGGDEFAIVLQDVTCRSDVEILAHRLIAAIDEPMEIAGRKVGVGLSVGFAFGDAGVDPDLLLRQADTALYDAKASGRRCFRRFLPEMAEQRQRQRANENEVRTRRTKGGARLGQPPQVAASGAETVGNKAL